MRADGRSKQGRKVDGVETEDEGQWVILDMYDDTSKSSPLIKLHHLNQFPISKLIHRCCAFFIIILPAQLFRQFYLRLHPHIKCASSEVPRQNPNVSFTSPFSGNPISPLDNIRPIPTQAIPYPEWRINVVVQARKAGLGARGKAMDLVK